MNTRMIHIFMCMAKRFKAKQNIAQDSLNLCGSSINFKENNTKTFL